MHHTRILTMSISKFGRHHVATRSFTYTSHVHVRVCHVRDVRVLTHASHDVTSQHAWCIPAIPSEHQEHRDVW